MGCGVPPFGDPLSCVTDVAGGAASSISGDFFGAIAKDFGQAADGATQWLWNQIGSATEVSLVSGPGRNTFYFYLGLVGSIALVVATGLFVVQIIVSVLRTDAQGLRKALTGLLVAFLGGSFAIGYSNGTIVRQPTANLYPALADNMADGMIRDMLALPDGDLVAVTDTGMVQRLSLCDDCISNAALSRVAAARLQLAVRLGLAVRAKTPPS